MHRLERLRFETGFWRYDFIWHRSPVLYQLFPFIPTQLIHCRDHSVHRYKRAFNDKSLLNELLLNATPN